MSTNNTDELSESEGSNRPIELNHVELNNDLAAFVNDDKFDDFENSMNNNESTSDSTDQDSNENEPSDGKPSNSNDTSENYSTT